MSLTPAPKPAAEKAPALNRAGLPLTAYRGLPSTLCSGCGHDAITNMIVRAGFELNLDPSQVAKLSGIGCSSKTTAYFLGQSHGFNGVHGRMAAIATGVNLANHTLLNIGISGDGDTASIGLGQFLHMVRRNVHVCYIVENNGVYGLTKGQFSASADPGSTNKQGTPNTMEAIDGVLLALSLGATFVARSFSGDKDQLVPILKAGLLHQGFAFVDVVSPCVTFNDHVGSTKSYAYTREHAVEVVHADLILPKEEITADYEPGSENRVTMHDGSTVRLHKVAEDYDPSDRDRAYNYVRSKQRAGELVTGMLYLSTESRDMMEQLGAVPEPLISVPYSDLCPGSEELARLQERFR